MPAPMFTNILDKLNSTLIEIDSGCWVCSTVDSSTGYGKISFYGSRHYAHRLAWELTHGAIPKGMSILHKCDNPPCCNPNHLFVGTQSDNMKDMCNKGRYVGSALLTVEEVKQIKQARKLGITQQVLADKYRVRRQTISDIDRGINWSHVK